jgi:hypothetical protein
LDRQELMHKIIKDKVISDLTADKVEYDDEIVDIEFKKQIKSDNKKENQAMLITEIANFVHKTSRKFDLDS